MHVVNLAARLSEEVVAETSHTSPYVFGAFTFVALLVLLFATMMIKVGR